REDLQMQDGRRDTALRIARSRRRDAGAESDREPVAQRAAAPQDHRVTEERAARRQIVGIVDLSGYVGVARVGGHAGTEACADGEAVATLRLRRLVDEL